MANQYVNKVVINNETVVDLTGDNITPADVLYGRTAHDASGAPIVGTAIGGTLDHSELTNRDIINQHPISAITGLSESLNEKQDKAPTIVIDTSQIISFDPPQAVLTPEQYELFCGNSPTLTISIPAAGISYNLLGHNEGGRIYFDHGAGGLRVVTTRVYSDRSIWINTEYLSWEAYNQGAICKFIDDTIGSAVPGEDYVIPSALNDYRTASSQDAIDAAKYVKPSSGIPASDLASGVIPTALSQLSGDSTHRTVTDAEKSAWNAKGTYSKPSGGIPASDIAAGVIPPSGTRWFDWDTVTYEQLAAEYAVNKNIGIVDYGKFARLFYAQATEHNDSVFLFSHIFTDGTLWTCHEYEVHADDSKYITDAGNGHVPFDSDKWKLYIASGTEENGDFDVSVSVSELTYDVSQGMTPAIMYSNAAFVGTPAVSFLYSSHVGAIEIDGTPTLGAIFSGRAILDSATMLTQDIVIVADLIQNEWHMLVDKNLMDERIDSKIQNAIGNAIGGSY